MAEKATNPISIKSVNNQVPLPEKLDEALALRLRNWLALHIQIAKRVIDGEVVPENSAIIKERDKEICNLGRIFLNAAERGNAARLLAFVENGFPVNFSDPNSGETALHIVAANGARRSLRALMSTGRCEYFVYDGNGRLPSELAYLYGEDLAVARLLAIKEKKKASTKPGRIATRRPTLRRT